MNKNTKIKVVYIAGNGHSGSTLLDMILGSNEDVFSGGELNFITRKSILKEFCSCGELVSECQIWSEIFKLWDFKRKITLEEYRELQWKFERNKVTLRALWNKNWPSKEFIKYQKATLELFVAIQKVTGASVVIDSSKSPQRIATLNTIVDLEVIHLCRNFSGVLNSAKNFLKKDIKAGIEEDILVRRSVKTFIDWLMSNFFTELFCVNVNSIKLRYQDYVMNLDKLHNVVPSLKIKTTHLNYSADHMLAGNIIRLKKKIIVNSNIGFEYKRLSEIQRQIASLIDKLFWFWV